MRPFVLLAAGLLLLAGPLPAITWPWATRVVAGPATAAVYVYEKDDGPIPAGVLSGINRLNRERKIVASLFEDDVTDGAGEVPAQYRPAIAAAKSSGIPAFVVLSGTATIRVVSRPTTEAQVMGAVP